LVIVNHESSELYAVIPSWLGRLYLWLTGWQVVGEPPGADKYIIVAAPHTSNWDAPTMLAVAAVLRIRIHWTVKDSWCRGPIGWLMLRLGALPINRSSRHNVVDQVIEAFAHNGRLVLLVTPEGTRAYTEYWKSGFYYMALGAQVPLVLAVIDYQNKRGGLGPVLVPSGNITADMDTIRAHREQQHAKYPKRVGPVQINETEGRRSEDTET
jgi:1-acyl-sn-glycerol-3-phosphate acyltransferase